MTLVLAAVDSFHLARTNDVYLDALEHYLLATDELEREEILYLLRLFRASAGKELIRTEALLNKALGAL